MSLTLTAVALVVVLVGGYAWGRWRARRIQARIAANVERASATESLVRADVGSPSGGSAVMTRRDETNPRDTSTPNEVEPEQRATHERIDAERARLVRAWEGEAAQLREEASTLRAQVDQLAALADERRTLFDALAQARGETARYRQLVLDIEDTAPPPLLGQRGTPDDLKLIVGIGPMLERMLHQLGITTFRQIARWTERDIDEFDARLPEFRGRIRRDAWVTQARALHQSVHGESLTRERG